MSKGTGMPGETLIEAREVLVKILINEWGCYKAEKLEDLDESFEPVFYPTTLIRLADHIKDLLEKGYIIISLAECIYMEDAESRFNSESAWIVYRKSNGEPVHMSLSEYVDLSRVMEGAEIPINSLIPARLLGVGGKGEK